jgi:molybdate transport system ATP-binding protein
MTNWADIMNHENIHVSLKQSSPIPLDIEFSCNNGEIFVIAGPSGSGKTTILRSIAGLYKPLTGKIVCQGKTWYDTDSNIDLPIQNRAAGIVFQNYALFPHLTVRENIAIAVNEQDKKLRTEYIDELLDTVHLNGLDSRLPYQLSGGQQQRVAVARSLARKPEILLLDEPFSSIDQQTRRYLVRELVQLRSRLNIPIIHVTHDLNEARRIADKLCIINDGLGLQIDTPENVMTKPQTTKVAKLTGHDNIFAGKLQEHDKTNVKSYINWHNKILETNYAPEFNEDEEVNWFIPSSQLIPLESEHSNFNNSNIFKGTILEVIQLGESSIITIELTGIPDILQMNYSTHQTREKGLATGSKIGVSLLAGGIHLMKHR